MFIVEIDFLFLGGRKQFSFEPLNAQCSALIQILPLRIRTCWYRFNVREIRFA